MRVLVDTNVVINREDYQILPKNLQSLLRILNSLKIEIIIHPKSINELKNDKNSVRREVNLSKIETYSKLVSPPDPTQDRAFLEKTTAANAHDKIDNSLLYAVYRDAVNFLITEDKKIHQKASKLNLKDRVLSCEEAVDSFKRFLPNEKVRPPPALREEPVHNLDVNSSFFDTLKQEYPDFETWFKKISREGRKCYVHHQEKMISALLIHKVENETIPVNPPLPVKKRLKLCLFKVERSGNRLGELFIRLSVKYCIQNGIDEMYLTYYTKEEGYLKKILFDYGFVIWGKKNSGEDVYLKTLIPNVQTCKNLLPLEIGQHYYPSFYDGINVKKFIIPIRPKYHNRLFTDSNKRQSTINEFNGSFIIEGNTINKVYLSHSRITKISKGDIIFFYRSHDLKEVTALGVVEEAIRMEDPQKIAEKVGNRTVYSYEEIVEKSKKPTLVLLFRWHFYLPKPLTLKRLKEMNALQGAPQTIIQINHEKYLTLKKESQLDERYTVN